MGKGIGKAIRRGDGVVHREEQRPVPAAFQLLRQHFLQLFPAQHVEIRKRGPLCVGQVSGGKQDGFTFLQLGLPQSDSGQLQQWGGGVQGAIPAVRRGNVHAGQRGQQLIPGDSPLPCRGGIPPAQLCLTGLFGEGVIGGVIAGKAADEGGTQADRQRQQSRNKGAAALQQFFEFPKQHGFLLSYLMPGVNAPGQRQKDHHVQRQNDQ